MGRQHLRHTPPDERGLAGQEEESDRSQAVEVAPSVRAVPAGRLLGGHVRRRARKPDQPGRVVARVARVPRLHQAEVEQLGHVVDPAAGAHHDVPRLDVPMDQAGIVRLPEGVTDLPQQVHRPPRRERAVPADHVLQGQPRQVFHDVVERPVLGVTVVVDLHRIRVRQPGRRLDFPLEAIEAPGIADPLGPDELDRARPAEEAVFRQVDLPHAARPQPLRQPVLAQLPRLAGLPPQDFDVVRAEHREQGPESRPEPEGDQVKEERSARRSANRPGPPPRRPTGRRRSARR